MEPLLAPCKKIQRRAAAQVATWTQTSTGREIGPRASGGLGGGGSEF